MLKTHEVKYIFEKQIGRKLLSYEFRINPEGITVSHRTARRTLKSPHTTVRGQKTWKWNSDGNVWYKQYGKK